MEMVRLHSDGRARYAADRWLEAKLSRGRHRPEAAMSSSRGAVAPDGAAAVRWMLSDGR